MAPYKQISREDFAPYFVLNNLRVLLYTQLKKSIEDHSVYSLTKKKH